MTSPSGIRGVLFDLDGTLVDSVLDFDQMRREMKLPQGVPILETLSTLPADEAERCRAILARHEVEGARRATVMPGVREFLSLLEQRGVRSAVITRNTRALALDMLTRLRLEFELVIAREDGPVKPDPAAVWKICDLWGLQPQQTLVIGDYHYDMDMGRRAGSHTVLYTAGREPTGLRGYELADHVIHSFAEAEWLLNIGAT